jgi:hypothetical protein
VLGVAAGTILAFGSVLNVLSSLFPALPDTLYSLADFLAAGSARLAVPAILLLSVSVLFGTPIFIGLGGVAFLLFVRSGGAPEMIPSEAYGMLTGYSLPAIPLFTFAGFILSESQAGKRLVRLFKAFVASGRPGHHGGAGLPPSTLHRRHRGDHPGPAPCWPSRWASGATAGLQRGAVTSSAPSACSSAQPADHHLRGHRPDQHQHMFAGASCPDC